MAPHILSVTLKANSKSNIRLRYQLFMSERRVYGSVRSKHGSTSS